MSSLLFFACWVGSRAKGVKKDEKRGKGREDARGGNWKEEVYLGRSGLLKKKKSSGTPIGCGERVFFFFSACCGYRF
jgi:hypothetical protein